MGDDGVIDAVNKDLLAWGQTALRTDSVLPHLLDEIALEGLDGITLQALRIRLRERRDTPIDVTEKSFTFIWNVLTRLKGVEFYELPEARGNLILYRRTDYVDERGNMYEPLSAPEDLYTYSPVDKMGVRGSCRDFDSHKLIPDLRGMSLKDVESKYGNKLVVVASQKLREQALLGPGSEGTGNMTIVQYCMLERIGRARYEGESTRGNVSLQTMKMDPKALFYQRKYLIRKKMMKKQVFSMKFGKNRSTSLISILHLPRFYTPFVPVALVMARKMISYLKKKSNMREESAEIKRKFGKTTYRTLLSKDFEHLFREADISVAELNPEAFQKEKKQEKRDYMLKKTQKAFIFLNPPGDVESHLPNMKEQEFRSGDVKGDTFSFIKGITYADDAHMFDTPLHRSQELICRGGSTGVTLLNISSYCKMNSLAARTSGRFCVKAKYAKSAFVEKGKTKANKYLFTNVFPVPPPITSFPDTEKLPILGSGRASSKKQVRAQVKSEAKALSQWIDSLVTPSGGLDQTKRAETAAVAPTSNNDLILRNEQDSSQFQLVPVESDDSPSPSKKRRKVDKAAAEVQPSDGTEESPVQSEKFARLFLGKEKERKKVVRKKLNVGQNISFKKSKDGLYYDEKDLEALAKKNKQRVTWTVEEDQMILLLFISSVVFIRKYNLKKLFIFNAAQMRDMLHIKSEESRHKTSLAIRRRMHFLIKNATFRSKYTYYLHDAVRDDNIFQRFVAPFEETVDSELQKIYHSIPTESILEVYDYLLQKHGSDLAQPKLSWGHHLVEDSCSNDETVEETDNKNGTNTNGVVPVDETVMETEEISTDSSDGAVDDGCDEGLIAEEVECWAYDGTKKVMVDAVKDPTTAEEVETWICRTVVFSLMFSGDSVSDVESFLERFGDDSLDFIASHCRKLNICSINRRSHKFGLSSVMRRRLANHLHPSSYRGANAFLKLACQNLIAAHPTVTTNNAALFSLVEFLQNSKIDVDIRVSRDCTKESETGRTPFTINPMRRKKSKLDESDENMVVNLPSVEVKVPRDMETIIWGASRNSPEENMEYLTELLFRRVPLEDFQDSFVESCTRGDPAAIKCSRLYLTILQSGEVGISMRLLRTKFKGVGLKEGLVYLISQGYIYSVGVTQRKFIAVKYVERWTMKVPLTSGEGFQRVIIHPWITSTGCVNWELVDRMLTAVLGVICLHPSVRVLQIMRYLSPVISGFEVALLLQAIIHFGFVNFYKIVRSHDPQLFASRSNFEIDTEVDPFLELEDLVVEPKPFATSRYALLQEMFNADKRQTVTSGDEITESGTPTEMAVTASEDDARESSLVASSSADKIDMNEKVEDETGKDLRTKRRRTRSALNSTSTN